MFSHAGNASSKHFPHDGLCRLLLPSDSACTFEIAACSLLTQRLTGVNESVSKCVMGESSSKDGHATQEAETSFIEFHCKVLSLILSLFLT